VEALTASAAATCPAAAEVITRLLTGVTADSTGRALAPPEAADLPAWDRVEEADSVAEVAEAEVVAAGGADEIAVRTIGVEI
jgi:hypothetical protein